MTFVAIGALRINSFHFNPFSYHYDNCHLQSSLLMFLVVIIAVFVLGHTIADSHLFFPDHTQKIVKQYEP